MQLENNRDYLVLIIICNFHLALIQHALLIMLCFNYVVYFLICGKVKHSFITLRSTEKAPKKLHKSFVHILEARLKHLKHSKPY